jgi:hypothetical protein
MLLAGHRGFFFAVGLHRFPADRRLIKMPWKMPWQSCAAE